MAVIAFFSAKGSPGSTTGALLATALWPARALLLDADASGGDVGLRLSTGYGRPLDLDRGLLTLLPLARRTLDPTALLTHSQIAAGGSEVIVGLGGPDQAIAAGPMWRNIGDACAELADRDVIIDLGRVSARSSVLPLLQTADVGVCVVPTSVSGVVHARERLRSLLPLLTGPNGIGPRLVVVLRSLADDPGGRDVAGTVTSLQQALPDVPVVGRLPHDPLGAGIFDSRPVSRPERTMLVRAGAEMVAQLTSMVHMAGGPGGPQLPPEPRIAGHQTAAGATAESTGRSRGGRRRAPGSRRRRDSDAATATLDTNTPVETP